MEASKLFKLIINGQHIFNLPIKSNSTLQDLKSYIYNTMKTYYNLNSTDYTIELFANKFNKFVTSDKYNNVVLGLNWNIITDGYIVIKSAVSKMTQNKVLERFNWSKFLEIEEDPTKVTGDNKYMSYGDEEVRDRSQLPKEFLKKNFVYDSELTKELLYKVKPLGENDDDYTTVASVYHDNVGSYIFSADLMDDDYVDFTYIFVYDQNTDEYLIVGERSSHPNVIHKRFVYTNSDGSGPGLSVDVTPESGKNLINMAAKYQEKFLSNIYH